MKIAKMHCLTAADETAVQDRHTHTLRRAHTHTHTQTLEMASGEKKEQLVRLLRLFSVDAIHQRSRRKNPTMPGMLSSGGSMHPFNWFIRTCIFLLIVLCEYSIIACDSWSADSQSLKNLRESLRIFGEVIVEVGGELVQDAHGIL